MQEVDPGALAHHVPWAAFALALALGSFLALAAIVGGALLALRYQGWRVERSMA